MFYILITIEEREQGILLGTGEEGKRPFPYIQQAANDIPDTVKFYNEVQNLTVTKVCIVNAKRADRK